MQPKIMTTTTVKISAFKGSLSVGWTLAKNRDAGRPPSLVLLALFIEDHATAKYIPCESENHSTACSHHTKNGENQAHQR